MSETRYLVAARKYRPKLFHELVAQEHVTETLKNAIRLDRLAHAYLFSGPRGVGKTTAARILAKAINCTTPPEERPDAAEPCRQCASCQSFEEGRSLNIIEIDAASNNKVEDIRDLRDTVRVPPQGSRKKVYIVDEVHMLSNAAFNALLKTLEEPPPYVLFIFATTEPNKVLPTILSRCQRFDFRRIPVPNIMARLREICEAESITADEESLMLIARKGDGALRDALSAFDQAISLCGTDLRYDDLSQALGVVSTDLYFEVTQHVIDRSGAGMLRLVDRIVSAGYDLQEFLAGVAEHVRNLLVARSMPDPSLIEAAEATRRRYAEVAQHFEEPDLLRLLMIVAEAEDAVKSSTQPRLRLEMALLQMAALAHTTDLRNALTQLDRLERLARDGKLPAMPAETSTAPKSTAPKPTAAPQSSVKEPEAPAPQKPSADKSAPAEPKRPTSNVSHEPREQAPEPDGAQAETAPPVVDEPAPIEKKAEPESTPSQAAPSPRSEAPASSQPAERSSIPEPSTPGLGLFDPPALGKKKSNPADPSGDGGAPQNLVATAAAPEVDVAVAEPEVTTPVARVWAKLVKQVSDARIHVGALLAATKPLSLEEGILHVAVPDDFHQRMLDNQSAFICRHLVELIEADVDRLEFVIRATKAAEAAQETAPEADPLEYLSKLREEDPVVKALFERFGGEIAW